MSSGSTLTTSTWSYHFRHTIALGLPLAGSHLAQMLTHTTDVVMLGWYGVDELAAAILAIEYIFVVFLVGSGFSQAVMPMVANALGANDWRLARRSVRMGAWITIAYSIVWIPGLLMVEEVLLALGQEPHLCKIADAYMQIGAWGLLPALLIMLFKSFLAAHQRAGLVLKATVIGAIANAILNYVLIFGNFGAPELGIRGAAISSVVTALLTSGFLLYHVHLISTSYKLRLFSRLWIPDVSALTAVFRLGWPISMTMLAEVGLFSTTKIMIGWLGTIPLAAHGIVLQIIAIAFMVPLGLANAATIRAAFATGKRDLVGLRRGSVSVIILTLAVSLTALTVVLAVPEQLVNLFLDSSHTETRAIVDLGVVLLMFVAACQTADAIQVVVLGLLRGVEDTKIPMVFAVISYWGIGLPIAYVAGFQLDYGAPGVWSGLVVGLIASSILLSGRYLNRLRHLEREI